MSRILLIEDDAGTRFLFRSRLEELGHEVVVASTGARGLLEARSSRFDLFLVAVELGSGIDGYEVCRRLKAVPRIRGTPVVLISGEVRSQDELHAGYEAGSDAFVAKGDLTLVGDVVRAMLRTKSLQDELGLQNRLLAEKNRRLQEEGQRGADLEVALRATGGRALAFRELAAGRPDGILIVDGEGVVRMTDRAARDILGKRIEGRQLASVAPGTGLEAFVRDARSDPHEAYPFDVGGRRISASVVPTVPGAQTGEPPFKVVLLLDVGKRRVAAEVVRLQEHGAPRRELGTLLEAAHRAFRPAALVGRSEVMTRLRARVARAAGQDQPVVVRGEKGTGKELVARILHFSGPAGGPFVPVHCAALAPALLEGELLGHVKGAFPEALADRPGLIQRAQHGTIFLDEVDALPASLAARLLDVLREKRIRRLGSEEAEPVSVRVVAATRAEPEPDPPAGELADDLLARLDGIEIRLPPLRERDGDVEALAEHFIDLHGTSEPARLDAEALWVMGRYPWPGNVRELESCIESACARAEDGAIGVSELSQPVQDFYKRLVEDDAIPAALPVRRVTAPEPVDGSALEPVSLQLYEKMAIHRALREAKGDKLAAARLLKIGKSTFYRKLKVHGIG